MPRDSILDEAERKQKHSKQNSDDGDGAEDVEEEAPAEERERLTQRVPADLLDDIEAIEKKYRLGSRNATINFMLSHAADDLLGRE